MSPELTLTLNSQNLDDQVMSKLTADPTCSDYMFKLIKLKPPKHPEDPKGLIEQLCLTPCRLMTLANQPHKCSLAKARRQDGRTDHPRGPLKTGDLSLPRGC
jgi:hypothetical protein